MIDPEGCGIDEGFFAFPPPDFMAITSQIIERAGFLMKILRVLDGCILVSSVDHGGHPKHDPIAASLEVFEELGGLGVRDSSTVKSLYRLLQGLLISTVRTGMSCLE